MANSVCEVLITESRLKAPTAEVDPGAGAIVDFWGVVRQLEDGREIEGIDYEANTTMAQHQLQAIVEESVQTFGLNKVIVHHRIGFVRAGEPSLFLQVCAPHRAAAFDASKWIVDELKKRVPIWKRPKFRIENSASGVVRARPGSTTPATKRSVAATK